MEIIDSAIQGAVLILSGWVLVQWWRQDARIAVLCRFLAAALAAGTLMLFIGWISYSNGINTQYLADQVAIQTEWRARLDSALALRAKTFDVKTVTKADIGAIRKIADAKMVSASILSLKSWLLLTWLWLVLTFVASVPPLRANPDAAKDGASHED